MSQLGQQSTTNFLLQAMEPGDFALLRPHLTRHDLEHGQVLVEANEPIEHVWFPESGVASIVAEMADTGATEVGIFGREGVSGVSAMLGSDTSPDKTFMQIDGSTGVRIGVAEMRAAMDQSGSLRALLMRYVQTTIVQIAHGAVSNAHHRMEARLARWLLMCRDRVDSDEIRLTHEFMAMMVGVQRSGVTVTLHILEGCGAIRSKRGRVIILDREKLEELAGDAYGAPEAEYRRLIGVFGELAEAA